MKILCISRAPQYSPRSEERDAALFAAVAKKLQDGGHQVQTCEENALTALVGFELIFSMARSNAVLQKLAEKEAQGTKIFNSPTLLMKYHRAALTELYEEEEITAPLSVVIPLKAENEKGWMQDRAADIFIRSVVRRARNFSFPLWVKRADESAQEATDIQFIESPEKLEEVLFSMLQRGVGQVIISEHIEGDLIKFYGVEGTPFFHYSYPTKENDFSKFGHEIINGRPTHFSFNADKLKKTTDRIATKTGFTIYGGDAIISSSGEAYIIDFNDIPSFAACREDAVVAITNRMMQK